MKPVRNNNGSFSVDKGNTRIIILPGIDRPYTPVRIIFDDTLYPCKKGLIDTVKAFETAESEEQVLEVLFSLI